MAIVRGNIELLLQCGVVSFPLLKRVLTLGVLRVRSLTSVLRVLELDLVCRQRVSELLLVRRKLVNFRLIRIRSGFQRINDLIPFFHLFPERSDVSLSWGNPVCLGKTPASDSKCHQHTYDFTVFFDLFYYPAHTMCSLTHVKSDFPVQVLYRRHKPHTAGLAQRGLIREYRD